MLGGDLDVNPVFELDNRGKRGIVVDLSTERGRDVAERLLAGADVLVTNLRPGALGRLGLDPDDAPRAAPRARLRPHHRLRASTGPDADRAAYDIAAYWARAGIAESLRAPGGPLPFQRGGMGDHSGGHDRRRDDQRRAAWSGPAPVEGQLVSTSLLRQGAYTIGFDVNVALMWGRTLAGRGPRDDGGARPSTTTPPATAGRSGSSGWRATGTGRRWPGPSAARSGLTDERFADAVGRADATPSS